MKTIQQTATEMGLDTWMNDPLEKVKSWCREKESIYFQRRDVMRIGDLSAEDAAFYLRLWEKRGDIAHTKGSKWYKLDIYGWGNVAQIGVKGAKTMNNYLRRKMSEESFIRKILPAMGVPTHMMDGPGQ